MTIQWMTDDLSRLTAADYSNGDYYHYTYDAVGNRETQTSMVHRLHLHRTAFGAVQVSSMVNQQALATGV